MTPLEWSLILGLTGFLGVLRFRSSARPVWARPPSYAGADAVSPCVRGPLMRVPDLKGAYDALPAHCWRVLNSGRN